MTESIAFTLNDKSVRVQTDGERPLLWVLRTDFGLTGPKYGCGEGLCGACTVLLDEEAVRSCQVRIKDVRGKAVRTIEGLARGATLHPLQQAFVEHEALQCGFCTPGMILTAFSVLEKNPRATDQEIRAGLEDNLCRCGAHTRIVQAVRTAADRMREGGRR